MGWTLNVIFLVALQYISPLCGVPHHRSQFQPVDDNYDESTGVLEDENTDLKQFPDSIDPDRLDLIGNYLAELVLMPSNGKGLPLLYVEDEPADDIFTDLSSDEEQYSNPEISETPLKRSRYYRRYPWKRQNSRQTGCKSQVPTGNVEKWETNKIASNWIAPKIQAHPRRQNRHSSFLYATKYNSPKYHPRVIKHSKIEDYDAENRYLCQPSKDDVLRLLVALHETRRGTRGRSINFCNRKRPATSIFTNIRFLG